MSGNSSELLTLAVDTFINKIEKNIINILSKQNLLSNDIKTLFDTGCRLAKKNPFNLFIFLDVVSCLLICDKDNDDNSSKINTIKTEFSKSKRLSEEGSSIFDFVINIYKRLTQINKINNISNADINTHIKIFVNKRIVQLLTNILGNWHNINNFKNCNKYNFNFNEDYRKYILLEYFYRQLYKEDENEIRKKPKTAQMGLLQSNQKFLALQESDPDVAIFVEKNIQKIIVLI